MYSAFMSAGAYCGDGCEDDVLEYHYSSLCRHNNLVVNRLDRNAK